MFERDLISTKSMSKGDSEQTYHHFLKDVGLDRKEYPFILDGLGTFKGRPTSHSVSGWGGYFNADNVWTIFIAYRCNNPKHTIQHAWSWDAENSALYEHRVMEFIN